MIMSLLLLAALVVGLWLLDRRAAGRLTLVEKASKAGAATIAAEIDDRLGKLVAGETETRKILGSMSARLSGMEVSIGLLPDAMQSTRTLLEKKFEEWEERQVPPEGQAIAPAAMSRIRSVRERQIELEEASLKALTESIAHTKGFREPLIRVRTGD